MNEIEEVYKNVAKGLLNNFFYNKKVFAKQEKDENNRIVFMTKYQGIDVVKIKYALKNKNAFMSYQQDQNNLKWICLDFDIQKNVQGKDYDFFLDETYRPKLLEDISITTKKLDELNIKYIIEYSGNRGIHIWILFDSETSKAVGFTILEKIIKSIEFKYAFKDGSGIVIDKYPKNGNSEGNKIGLGVKIPLSYHQKSNCYSFIIENIADIKKIENLDIVFLKRQLKLINEIKKNSINDLITILGIKKINNDEVFCRKNGFIEREYSLDEIKSMLKKSRIFQMIFSKRNLSEFEREILVGTLIRLKSPNNNCYGRDLLIEIFKEQENYNANITSNKLDKLKDLYPPLINEIENRLGVKCEFCNDNNIKFTTELIDGIGFIDSDNEGSLINWVIKAEEKYIYENDEVPLEFIKRELNQININNIKNKLKEIKSGKYSKKCTYYQFVRHEENKDRIMYAYSAEDRVISTTVMFLIDEILGGEYTTSSGYSYKLNRNKYKNYKIFESWNYLWMNYKKNIEDKIYDNSYNDYYLIKLDFKGFYDSINHIFLREIMYRKPSKNIQYILNSMDSEKKDEYINLCEYLISLCMKTNGNSGVPQGPAFARYLAELFMYQIDCKIKSLIDNDTEFYFRYVDDIVLLIENKEKADKILSEIRNKVKLLDLELNSNKCLFDKVRNIKYEVISDDLQKYFIDGIDEETPEFVKNKAKEMLEEIFDKIKNSNDGQINYKDVPFYLTHLIDERYLNMNRKEIIKSITSTNLGRGSMYKHFYNKIIFEKYEVNDIDFFHNIQDLSRANFINSLVINSYKLNKETLQGVLDEFLMKKDLKDYEKIELNMLALENGLNINEEIIDSKEIFDCRKYCNKLKLSENLIDIIISEIQKLSDVKFKIYVIERILSKLEECYYFKKFIDLIQVTIEGLNDKIEDNVIQLLYNLVAFSTLYLDNLTKVKKLWKILIINYKNQKLKENDWYKYEKIMKIMKFKDNIIISFLTSELSDNNVLDNEKISEIEMSYIYSLILYISKSPKEHSIKILNNEYVKKQIQKIAEEKNITLLEWCLDNNTQYFPSKEIALLNSQYNERIAMMKDRNKLLIRGQKDLFDESESVQEENFKLDGENRYFKIYNVNSDITNIFELLNGKEFFEAIEIINKINSQINEDKKIINIFEKGSLNKKGEVAFEYSKFDNRFVVDEDEYILKNMSAIYMIIEKKAIKKINEFKYDFGRNIKAENLYREFVPKIINEPYEKMQFLFKFNEYIKGIPDNLKYNDYEIEKAKIYAIVNTNIDCLKRKNDYSNKFSVLESYNTLENSYDDKLLYGKIEIEDENIYDIINTVKKSLSKNIYNNIVEDIFSQLDIELSKLENQLGIKSKKILKVECEYNLESEKVIVNEGNNSTEYDFSEIDTLDFALSNIRETLNEKKIHKLKFKKRYIYFAQNTIIYLPDFFEMILEIIKKKNGIYDYDKVVPHNANIENSADYEKCICNICEQNDIEKKEAERKLKIFLGKYDEKYYNSLIYLISKYKTINKTEMDEFIETMKKYIDDKSYDVYSLKNYDIDRNGLWCIIQKYENDFGRNKKYDKNIKKGLKSISKHKKIVIVSDVGISGRQFKTKTEMINFKDFEEIVLLNCIYTNAYQNNITDELKGLNIRFEGKKINEKEYMYNKLNNRKKDELKEFFTCKANEKIMKKKLPYNNMKYKEYVEQINNEETCNILLARYKSMPKPHHAIFDDVIFKYRIDK